MIVRRTKKSTTRANKLPINNKQIKNKYLTQAILRVKAQIVQKKENLMLFLRI